MPTYDYQCTKCRKSFEYFQSMKDAPLAKCPKDACRQKTWGKGKVQRMLGTGAGLIFKGSGFYITDYRSEGYKASAKKDSNGGESSGGSSGSGESGSGGGSEARTGDAGKKAEAKPAPAEKPKPAAKAATTD